MVTETETNIKICMYTESYSGLVLWIQGCMMQARWRKSLAVENRREAMFRLSIAVGGQGTRERGWAALVNRGQLAIHRKRGGGDQLLRTAGATTDFAHALIRHATPAHCACDNYVTPRPLFT